MTTVQASNVAHRAGRKLPSTQDYEMAKRLPQAEVYRPFRGVRKTRTKRRSSFSHISAPKVMSPRLKLYHNQMKELINEVAKLNMLTQNDPGTNVGERATALSQRLQMMEELNQKIYELENPVHGPRLQTQSQLRSFQPPIHSRQRPVETIIDLPPVFVPSIRPNSHPRQKSISD